MEKQQKEKREKSGSTWQNIRLVMGALFKCYPQTRWQVPVYMISRVGIPFLDSLIPAVMIQAILDGSVKDFVWTVVGILTLNGVLSLIQKVLNMELLNRGVYTRLRYFFDRFLLKNLETDYANVEPQKQQKMIQKGCMALNSNWVGPEQLTRTTIEFVIQLLGLITYFSVIVSLDVRIMVVLVLMFVSGVAIRTFARNYSYTHREENTEVYRKRDYIKRSSLDLKAGKDVRIYQVQDWFHQVFEQLRNQAKAYQVKVEIPWFFSSVSDQFWMSVRDILAYSVLIGMVLAGEMEVATCTLLIGMIGNACNWMWNLSDNYSAMKKASLEVDDMQKVMKMPEHFLREGGEPIPDGKQALKIEFRDVCFRYEGAETDTLSHLSFVIQPGEKLALVGNNGAGKTTLVKLLCGLYRPTAGQILVDNRDISRMNLKEYYTLLSVLFQDVNSLAFTIATNVTGLSKEDVNQERLQMSLQRAGLWEKVQQLEQGVETYITQTIDESGIQLSGGETQKMLLARAIYKDAPILVLDEPTSALDPIAESAIYEEYNQMTNEKTSLFISHRLASTKFCDRIFFLEGGSIVEQGSHEELMKLGGRYKEIFDIQSHYYQEGEVVANEA
ncbi:MAG: ABC transporter ATP-binding protein [Lachnospiraceae bacterium]|nr:ABC transporter ATP-binding protein [Lachnospiraceae bacterium]